MKTTTALVALVSLVALSGLATAGSVGANASDVKGGHPSIEWALAMKEKFTPHNSLPMTITTLEVPVGGMVVGHVVDGKFVVSAVPGEAVPTSSASIGCRYTCEPSADCENDVTGSTAPISPDLVFAALPNIYSADQCPNVRGLSGPVNYFSFHTSGDGGGRMSLWGPEGYFDVGCSPGWNGGVVLMAGSGAGIGSVFKNTLDVGNAWCYISSSGPEPSAWSDWTGSITNSNYRLGDAYALVVTSGVPIGNIP